MRRLAWLLIPSLALGVQAAEFSKDIPQAPIVPALGDMAIPALPQALPSMLPSAPDIADALQPIPAISPVPAAPAAAPASAIQQLQQHFAGGNLQKSFAADPSGRQAARSLDNFFSGSRRRGGEDAAPYVPSGRVSGQSLESLGFIKNDEGVWVGGRVADMYRDIRKRYEKLSPHMDLSETMNVMDDAFDEARVKLAGVEKAAGDRQIVGSSVHLEETLTWIDAVMIDNEGHHIAEHTHRVFFHPANNPESEINEGIRRVDSYLEKSKVYFAKGGQAEAELGFPLDEVNLTFDTRGYKQIEDHLRAKQAELQREFPGRYHFSYITEPKRSNQQIRADYNRLVEKYKDQPKGVINIVDGVTYSRYVGLDHELASHEDSVFHRHETVLQAGRDFFEDVPQKDGSVHRRYITEFDAVVRKPDGTVVLREDKSARVPLPLEEVMQDKFLYKLDIYKKNQALIEKSLGAPLNVRFSVDVGGTDRRAARAGHLLWNDPRQEALFEHLKTQGPILSKKYGFPVEFVFVNTHPNEDLKLFYQKPITLEQWQAMQHGGGRHGQRGQGRGRR